MLVRECMITNPLMIDAGATVGAAARSMRTARTGRLCVVAGDRLVGVATWTDLARVPPSRVGDPNDVALADVMTTHPVVIRPGALMEEAARTLYWHGLQALPVVEDQRLIGLITSRDVIGVFIRRVGADIRGISMAVNLSNDRSDLCRLSESLEVLRSALSPFALNVRVDQYEARARIRVASPSLRVAEQLAAAGYTISELSLDTSMEEPRSLPRREHDEGSTPGPDSTPHDPRE
ncbi:MAG TPA: CBS domain-containing protein [bacterium]|nr:CBS domain-containing protein [bacterium]